MLGKKRVIEIIALHIEGKSVVEIGKAVNLSKSRVAQDPEGTGKSAADDTDD